MDSSLVIVALAGIAINAVILYLVISAATKASERAKYEWVQMELLAKIAKAQGVPEHEIKETFKEINPFAR